MRIALLGTGLLGSAVARRLHERGHQVHAWNRSSVRAAPLAEAGIQIAGSAAKAVAAGDIAILLLSDASAIQQVLFEPLDRPVLAGKTLIQMATIAPAESRQLAEQVAAQDGLYLEAPVLGSLPEARQGNLIVMAGGGEDTFQACLPLLSDLSGNPQLIGPAGQGAALKLAMNQLIASLTTGFALSLGLVRAEGVAVEQFMDLLRHSALYAPTFDKKLDKYLNHRYDNPNFPLKHLIKDSALFAQVARQDGIDERPLRAMLAVFEDGAKAGLGELDYSALYEAVNTRPRGG